MSVTTNSGTAPEQATSLGHVVGMVKDWVERCGWIWVEAQVIELRRRSAPTQFLTLRDTHGEISASITCMRAVLDAAGPLTEGTTVLACIKPRVYAARASLSFDCSEIRIAGEGVLLAQLELLKRKLQAEGLFDPIRKKKLPFLPDGIGLITGAKSAAERDVVRNVQLRWPAAHIVTRYALMQGANSAGEVITALQEQDADPNISVIVIARGGGSLEDLLPFSDEGLVRAVADAKTPVVSAIGHEVDTPILDLVADLRASTPTDAAKRIVPDAAEELAHINQARLQLRGTIAHRVTLEADSLTQLRSRPVLRNPTGILAPHYERLATITQRLNAAIVREVSTEQTWLTETVKRSRAISPRATLERGYAVLATKAANSITSVEQVNTGDELCVLLADGNVGVAVQSITQRNKES